MKEAQAFGVLVTRPSPDGEALCQILQEQGFKPYFFPLIEIKANEDPRFLEQLKHLEHYDWAIFVSRQAVASIAPKLKALWPSWPSQLKVAAVGEGTAKSLEAAQCPVHRVPATWNSEALLALPEFQALAGKKIAIVCAPGGRELLTQALRERGAEVELFFAYQRLLPQADLEPILRLLKEQAIQALLCTSVQALKNLEQLFAGLALEQLKKIPLVLVSERIMILAKAQGFSAPVLAADPSHQCIVQVLQTIRKQADACG